MKSRFNALDLRAVAQELQPVLSGARVLNIYDHLNRSIVIKLGTTGEKRYLIVEPGVRIHLAQDALLRLEQQKRQPTGLVMKLRKCLKGRRLMRVEQCGWDRSVRLEFGYFPFSEEEKFEEEEEREEELESREESQSVNALNLFVEFFSQGNLVLCEPDTHRVLAVSRPITNIPGVADLTIGSHYVPSTAPPPSLPTLEQVSNIYMRNVKVKELKNALKSALPLLPLSLIDMCKGVSGEYFYVQARQFYELALREPLSLKPGIIMNNEENDDYEEFLSICSTCTKSVIYCDTFNEAVDKYFCKLEVESNKSKQSKLEESALSKLQAIEQEQKARIEALRSQIDLTLQKAQMIESNGDVVQGVCAVVKVAVESGMDWRELGDLIREEKRTGRATAQAIHKLKLDRQLAEITLPEGLLVDVNYTLSVHGNANWYYEQRKQAIAKLERTLQANEAALKSAKAKIDADLFSKRTATSRALIRSSKRTLWFEKYAWFLSSDHYLVLAGHDAQQNDVLVKRHLLKDDIYVHAQVNGAASVVVKNHLPNQAIPPRTLNEAGAFSVLHSRAWEGKVVIGSWWVKAEQVSKTAPSGEYLGTGAFMVRGRKNFIPPSPLQAGFAFLFLSTKPKISATTNCGFDKDVEEVREKYERALEVTDADADEDVVELVESGNVSINIPNPKTTISTNSNNSTSTNPTVTNYTSTTKGGNVRGKKGKMKKIKEKYKDQDEEERALRMALLGNPSSTKQNPKNDDDSKKKDIAVVEKVKEKKSQPQKQPKHHEDKLEEVAPTEEFSVLSYLHSNPTTGGDQTGDLLQAVPVCGPWSALRNYKYRVKLIPQVGSGPGKGKLCKNIVSLLSQNSSISVNNTNSNNNNNSNSSKQEVELIRAVTDVDLQHALSLNKCAMQLGATDSQTLRKVNKKSKQQAK